MLFLVSKKKPKQNKNMFRWQIGALNSSGSVSRIVSSVLRSSDVRAWWFDSRDISHYLKPNYRVLVLASHT